MAYLYDSIEPEYEGDHDAVLKILNEHEPLQHNECKEYKNDIPGLNVELYDYQRKGVSWMLKMEQNGCKYHGNNRIYGGLLCDEMGLGKTIQTIALMLIQKARNRKTKDRTIILTPVTLMNQWASELNEIATKGSFNILSYYGDDRDKISKSEFEKCDVIISSLDTFNNSVKNFNDPIMELPSGFFGRIVIDECPELKNGKKCENITAFCKSRNIKNRWALSGTPISDDIAVDLSGQCAIIGMPFKTYFEELTGYEPNFSKKSKVIFQLDFDDDECIEGIQEMLTSIMLRRTKTHLQSSPDFPKFKTVDDKEVPVKMNKHEQDIYDKQKPLLALRKVCNHTSLGSPKGADENVPSSKINVLMNKIKEIQDTHKGDKILIFSNFKETFKIISKQLRQRRIKWRECIAGSTKDKRVQGLAQFKDASLGYNVLLISTSCASVGLNLQCANHVIFVEPRYNGGADNQAIGRCWRLGQMKQVYVYRLITKGTVEERLRELMLKAAKKYKANLWSKKALNKREREYVKNGNEVDSEKYYKYVDKEAEELCFDNDDYDKYVEDFDNDYV